MRVRGKTKVAGMAGLDMANCNEHEVEIKLKSDQTYIWYLSFGICMYVGYDFDLLLNISWCEAISFQRSSVHLPTSISTFFDQALRVLPRACHNITYY